MSVGSFGLYGPDGRIHGCYTYMLFFPMDGRFFVKVGISNSPTKRLGGVACRIPG